MKMYGGVKKGGVLWEAISLGFTTRYFWWRHFAMANVVLEESSMPALWYELVMIRLGMGRMEEEEEEEWCLVELCV